MLSYEWYGDIGHAAPTRNWDRGENEGDPSSSNIAGGSPLVTDSVRNPAKTTAMEEP